ncbi:MAG: VUT family protein [Bacilli bacterium]
MNYVYLALEIILVFLLMFVFYKIDKKNGLFLYILLMSSIVSITMYKLISILSFQVNTGIPIIMGIFICSNIIIQKYGFDEVKRVIKTFICGYVMTFVLISFTSFVSPNNLIANVSFDSLFGCNINTLRTFFAGLIAISLMLWYNGSVYYYIRRNKNKILFSNIGSICIIQFLESTIFIIISYIGLFDLTYIFGMITVRYLLKVVIGIVGLFPVLKIVKMKG